ncbi:MULTISPECIES: hypothetical protein [unclassified Streptomyces]|uniref:hypothetical protein n=1 Tax=unclassified Streptomyces TaxID=2593676 RepID=UPI001F2FBF50|nr:MULTISPECIES: hypothetical protein [unclassified Streptomyces]MCF0086644.1 hypothetical protein [Streptomyces sp. MH192]MCF0098798.1 hypothetical protein [Streptomyces sp. MH191]
MTIPVYALPTGGHDKDPAHYAGRADAYDEHQAGADPDTLEDRYEWMTDPTVPQHTGQLVSTAYLIGYKAYIQDLRAAQYATRYRAELDYQAWLAATDTPHN